MRTQVSIDVCADHKTLSLALTISRLKNALIDASRRHIRIRYITEIIKNNLDYCKELISIVDELRHLNGIKGDLYISEEEYAASATLHKKKSSDMMIYSNAKEVVEHQQYASDSFWNASISAERSVTEIQSNISLGITEIIDNPSRTLQLFIDLIKSPKSEVLLLPTVNSFMREYRIGVILLLGGLSTQPEGRAINIRILTPPLLLSFCDVLIMLRYMKPYVFSIP